MHYILYQNNLPELPKINPSDEIVLFCKEDHFSIADVTKLLEFSSKQITLTPASSPEQTLLNVGILIGQAKDVKFLGDLKTEVEALLGESMPKQGKTRARKRTKQAAAPKTNDTEAVVKNEDDVAKKVSKATTRKKAPKRNLELPKIPHEEFGRKGESEEDIRHALIGCFRYETDIEKVEKAFNTMFPEATDVAKKYIADNQDALFAIAND